MSEFRPKILCIDDEEDILKQYQDVFSSAGYEVFTAVSAQEGRELIARLARELVLIICDFKMPGSTGFEVRKHLSDEHKKIPFVICSAWVSREMALEAVDLKISAFVDKPFDSRELIALVKEKSKERCASIEERAMLATTFFEESEQMLEEIEPLVLSLEDDPDNIDIVNAIFRNIHTIKGSSGVLEDPDFSKFAHKFEDLISAVKNRMISVNSEVIGKFLYGTDKLGELLEVLKQQGKVDINVDELSQPFNLNSEKSIQATKSANTPKPSQKVVGKQKESISVPRVTLDELMTQAGEITVIKNMVNRIVRSLEKTHQSNRDVAQLSELFEEMNKINSVIQGRITDLRKVPLSEVLKSVPRTIRDLSQSLGKPLESVIHNADLRVDTIITQALSSCLIHLVRNAADHGIEDVAQRRAHGKADTGKITLRCSEDRDEVRIEISDDGKGLNRDKILKKALEQSLLAAEEASKMPDGDVYKLIFASGFSTAEKISGVSGRGVGMDMVKSAIEAAGGRIDILSKENVGTTFDIHIQKPKSVLIVSSLLVEAAGQTFAIPQDNILRLLNIENPQETTLLRRLEGWQGESVLLNFDGTMVPVVECDDFFQTGRSREAGSSSLQLVVVSSESGTYALSVTQILDAEDIVAKILPPKLEELKVFSAATFNGDGSIGLIIDVDAIGQQVITDGYAKTDEKEQTSRAKEVAGQTSNYLVFTLNAPGYFAVVSEFVSRVERTSRENIFEAVDGYYLKHDHELIPVLNLVDAIVSQGDMRTFELLDEEVALLLMECGGAKLAFVIKEIVDIVTPDEFFPDVLSVSEMLNGQASFGEKIANIVDLSPLFKAAGVDLKVEEDAKLGEIIDSEKEIVLESGGSKAEASLESKPQVAPASGDGWGLF